MITKNTLPFLGSLITVILVVGPSVLVRAEEVLAMPKTMASSNYVLQPSDVIRVQIFQEPELLREERLSQESAISLPMIGMINLKGKTLAVAREFVRFLYDRDYLVNPQVSIFILDYAKRTVNILGAVNAPGVILFPQETGLTLLDAIARAGGFNRFADKKRLKLTRVMSDGKTENFTINAEDILQGTAKENWVLIKDDVISVPERVL
jgi:polysaccharide export outer membrane protein